MLLGDGQAKEDQVDHHELELVALHEYWYKKRSMILKEGEHTSFDNLSNKDFGKACDSLCDGL